MLAVPDVTPVTTPVAVPMFSAVADVLQLPPVTPSVSGMVAPTPVNGPPMAEGVALTVTVFTAAQPATV